MKREDGEREKREKEKGENHCLVHSTSVPKREASYIVTKRRKRVGEVLSSASRKGKKG